MNKINTKKKILIVIISLTIIASIVAIPLLKDSFNSAKAVDEPSNDPVIVEPVEPSEPEKKNVKEVYIENKEINDDIVGQIYFESGLIDLPVVQAVDNDYYFRRDWKTLQYDEEGSIFMDYESTLDSQNIVIYGHYVYRSYEPSGTHMFTPLALLLDKENYYDNKIVNLYIKGEQRLYEIVSVFYCKLYTDGEYQYIENPDMAYMASSYTDDEFVAYKAAIQENELYSTGVDYSNKDHFLTLQTCVENHDELREIVLCRELARVKD